MSRPGAFEVEGAVVTVLSDRTCQVELPNGHRLLAFVTGSRARSGGLPLAPGDKVTVELSAFDLSKGRIIGQNGRAR